MPQLLTHTLQKEGIASNFPGTDISGEDAEGSEKPLAKKQMVGEGCGEASRGRSTRLNTEPEKITLSGDWLEFITSTFSNHLSKKVWTTLLGKHPGIQGTANVLVAPNMETFMKGGHREKTLLS